VSAKIEAITVQVIEVVSECINAGFELKARILSRQPTASSPVSRSVPQPCSTSIHSAARWPTMGSCQFRRWPRTSPDRIEAPTVPDDSDAGLVMLSVARLMLSARITFAVVLLESLTVNCGL
jgi:hypothetical protein